MRGASDPRFRGDDREPDGGVNPALPQPRSRRAITCAWISACSRRQRPPGAA